MALNRLIFSTNQIPELKGLSIGERAAKIQQAELKLTAPEKLILNLLKLCMIIPPFFYLAQQNWLYLSIAIIGAVILKVVIFTPIKLKFLSKYLQ
ncbi:DUF6170 family protein [Thalassotalea sediminis]|uniref:DUF6170 family protein n=1 Tax=Thalassotalea sediminis TaxID=1759089 RepID=UPI0025731CDD|nr:DUF6170 family protein [Thalassotalea sediminis]